MNTENDNFPKSVTLTNPSDMTYLKGFRAGDGLKITRKSVNGITGQTLYHTDFGLTLYAWEFREEQ